MGVLAGMQSGVHNTTTAVFCLESVQPEQNKVRIAAERQPLSQDRTTGAKDPLLLNLAILRDDLQG